MSKIATKEYVETEDGNGKSDIHQIVENTIENESLDNNDGNSKVENFDGNSEKENDSDNEIPESSEIPEKDEILNTQEKQFDDSMEGTLGKVADPDNDWTTEDLIHDSSSNSFEGDDIDQEIANLKQYRDVSLNFTSIVNEMKESNEWRWGWDFNLLKSTPMYEEANIDHHELRRYVQRIRKQYNLYKKNLMAMYKRENATKKKHGIIQKAAGSNKPIVKIPDYFKDEDYDITSPNTLRKIFQHSGDALYLYQEKLAHYVDSVESDIVRQVSDNSKEILHSMLTLKVLNEQIDKVIPLIERLRKSIQETRINEVQRPKKISTLAIERKNIQLITQVAHRMNSVFKMKEKINQLIQEERYIEASETVDKGLVIIEDLCEINLMNGMSDKFKQLKQSIIKSVQGDLFEKIKNLNLRSNMEMQNSVKSLLGSLRNFNVLDETFKKISVDQIENTRSLFKELLEQIAKSSGGEITIAEYVRGLSHGNFISFTQTIIGRLMQIIDHVDLVVSIVLNFSKENDFHDANFDQTYRSVCDICHGRISLIISLRTGMVVHLEELLDIVTLVNVYLKNCESYRKSSPKPLLDAVKVQKQSFLKQFHEKKMEFMKEQVYCETFVWVRGIPKSFQDAVDYLRGFPDEPSDTDTMKGNSKTKSKDIKSMGTVDPEFDDNVMQFIEIGEHKFPVCNCALILIKIVADYFKICDNSIIQLGSEMQQIVNDLTSLFQQFNGTCKELVLGAKAIKEAGLKSITAKHLLICSETIHAISYIIPVVITKAYSYTSQIQVRNFLKLRKVLEQHRLALQEKVVAIMKHRLSVNSKKWIQQSWVIDDWKTPSVFMHTIGQDMRYLQKVLSEHLQTHERELIALFSRVIGMYYEMIAQSIMESNIPDVMSQNRLREDLDWIKSIVETEEWKKLMSKEVELSLFDHAFTMRYGIDV